MNYEKIYNQIIERAKIRNKPEGYFEKHHTIPRCIGGTNDKENLVYLTAREHFLCHYLLHLIYPKNNKLFYALNMMCNVKKEYQKRYKPSSRIYEYLKKNRKHTDITKNKISIAHKGKKKSKITKKKISDSRKGILLSEEHKKNIGLARKGKKCSKITKEKISLANKGFKHSKKAKQKMSFAKKGKVSPKKGISNFKITKPLGLYGLQNNLVKIFVSQKEASKYFNISRTSISNYYNNNIIFKNQYILK